MKKVSILASLATAAWLALPVSASFAAPANDARTHFEAIAAGNVPNLLQGYAEHAQFQWVGGPLDGIYGTAEEIRDVWTRFTTAQGPLEVKVADVRESANPQGATVTANVQFEGKNTIKVRYVLTYRDGKIASEVWQIDPTLNVVAAP